MNENEVQTPGATLMFELNSMSPWPPRDTTIISRVETPVGWVTLYITHEPKLRVVVQGPEGRTGYVMTGQLNIAPDNIWRIAFRCTPDLRIRLYGAGVLMADSDDRTLENLIHEIGPAKFPSLSQDFEARSEVAMRRRVEVFAARKPRRGRAEMPSSYAEAGLQREVAQLNELIPLCHAGHFHHVYGLAARLRLLVARGRNAEPLIQQVAVARNLALPVHAISSEDEVRPEASLMGNWALRDVAAEDTVKMDLDVWLELTGAAVDGRAYTNNDIIKAIADTVGAHFDPDLEPLVGMFEAMKSSTSRGIVSELERWTYNTTCSVKVLAEHVLGRAQV